MGQERYPILKTEHYIPAQRPDRVNRPHLLACLDEVMRHNQRLIVVSTRASVGKTQITSWLRQQSLPAAWLSLDEGDNDPQRFLAGFLFIAFNKAL